ncbi:hypothetical protein IL306_015320 [Fusarium sp. DS 682]|nr:hypothetical protein IL306_015320 [Fusarium sp. DS 682]
MARRKALTELPPTLNETYDRVLQRVMRCPPETQSCIRRALQWTALGTPKMDIASLCEAVSFQEDMDVLDADDIIEPEVISHSCGCLLRKSLDGNYFEFAHFTVLEYLEKTQVGDFRYSEEEAYRSFSQVSLNFLLLPCFDRVPTIVDTIEDAYAKERGLKHPFYKFAAHMPLGFQRNSSSYPLHLKIIEEESVLDLLKRLFGTEENGNFRAWIRAASSGDFSAIHELSTGPLHVALMLLSPKLCQYLIDNGVDVNGVRADNTPLAIAIKLVEYEYRDQQVLNPVFIRCLAETFKVLLDNGAGTSFVVDDKSCMASAIETLEGPCLIQFIRASSAVPEDAFKAFSALEWRDESDDVVLEAIVRLAVGEDACPQWKPLAALALSFSRGRGLALPNLAVNPVAYSYNDSEYQKALEIASKCGLIEELSTLISDPRFGGFIAKPTGFELLSAAAESTSANSGKVVELLLGSGIDPHISNSSGQNCLHISCESDTAEVALVLLSRGVTPESRDGKGQSSWHVACYSGHEKIIALLLEEDKNSLENLAALDQDGRTPFSAALHNGHTNACLALLDICPSEAKYFKSNGPVMQDAAMAGSLELFTALRDKGALDFDTSESESTPMHHLSASCTPEFVQYLVKFYDPFCADTSTKFPFQLFFERWLAHNSQLGSDETNPLDHEILKILIPKDHEFSNAAKITHAWEIVCATLALEEICCYAETFVSGRCCYYFSRDLQTLLSLGILSSYENTRKRSGLLPLIRSLKGWTKDHFCSVSIVTLLSQVMESSKINLPLQGVDDSYHLLKLALERSMPEVSLKLISFGVDIHRRVPADVSKRPMSLFEMACEISNVETFKTVLDTIPSQAINDFGPTGRSPLELVVKGRGPDRAALVEALNEKGFVSPTIHLEFPLIVEAAKKDDFDLVKCLADIGHDIFAVDPHGWGIVHWAASHDQINMLKWAVEMSSSPSQWQTLAYCVSWKTPTKHKRQKEIKDHVSLLHMGADRPDFVSYFLDNNLFDVNITTQYGRTALHHASIEGSLTCCQLLVGEGINVSAKDQFMKLAVDYALEAGYNEIATFLLKSGSPRPRSQNSAKLDMIWGIGSNEGLELARRRSFGTGILNGNLEQCKLAVSQGCSINQPLPSCHCCSPLFAAIRAQKDVIVNWLLDEGVSTNSSFCSHHSTQNLFSHAVTSMDSSTFIEKLLSAALRSHSISRAQLILAICQTIGKNNINVLVLIVNHFRKNVNLY